MLNFMNEIKKFLSISCLVKTLKQIIMYIYIIIMPKKKTTQEWVRYEPNKTYEITCTFTDEWQGLKSTECQNELQRLIHFNKFIQCTYLKLFNHCSYTLVTELSDPQVVDNYGKIPRLHLHGTITFGDNTKDLLLFKLNVLPNIGRYGRVQINKYRKQYWDEYMLKDQDLYGKWLKVYNSMDVLMKQSHKKKPIEKIDFFKSV